MLLIGLIFFAIPPLARTDALALPKANELIKIVLVAAALYLLGRVLSGAFGLERKGKLKGISPGGAANS
ncbi:MAG TPA: hypothetical protein PKN07_04800, partial [Bacillota bacterium]|nr:hypothetical protein [Bacillota bacterium]